MFSVSQILDLIKNKDKIPPEQFAQYISSISKELNSMGYSAKGFSGGFDFQSFQMINDLKRQNQQLQITNQLLVTSIQTMELMYDETASELKQMKEESAIDRLMLKARIIKSVQEA